MTNINKVHFSFFPKPKLKIVVKLQLRHRRNSEAIRNWLVHVCEPVEY